ncbi:MAG: SiaB family protein kinase [Thermoguttaceae bacterium]
MSFGMLEYYEMLKKNDINMIYTGPIMKDGIEGIGGVIRKKLEADDLSRNASKAVFSVFVEQMYNMLFYATEKDFDVSTGVFMLGGKDKTYFLRSGNIMSKHSVERLKQQIDHLNSLDKDSVKKYYKEQMRQENDNPESKGAGIGLTEIARQASSKIEYSFVPYGDDQTFFEMSVIIGGDSQPINIDLSAVLQQGIKEVQ